MLFVARGTKGADYDNTQKKEYYMYHWFVSQIYATLVCQYCLFLPFYIHHTTFVKIIFFVKLKHQNKHTYFFCEQNLCKFN